MKNRDGSGGDRFKFRTVPISLGMILMIGSILAHAAETRHAILRETHGTVEVRIGGAEWKPAEAGMVLYQNDEIRTGKESKASLLLDENGQTGNFELKPDSRLRLGVMQKDVQTGDKTTILDLALGQVLVHAQKLKGKSRFEVHTANSTTGVRGTTFLVSAAPKKETK